MKIRKAKKEAIKNAGRILDREYDHAVMLQVLWYIFARLNGGKHKVIIREDPFIDDELNNILSFVVGKLPKEQ